MPLLRRSARRSSTLALGLMATLMSMAHGCGKGSQPTQLKYRECGPQGTQCPDEEPTPSDDADTYPCGPQGATCPKPRLP